MKKQALNFTTVNLFSSSAGGLEYFSISS